MIEWWHFALLFGTGLIAGFIDAIAGGGGLLTLPVLLWSGLPPQVALGTNKFQAACGTAMATWNFAQAGLLRWREVKLGVTVTFFASVLGTLAVTHIDPAVLKKLIPWLLLAIGGYNLVCPKAGLAAGAPRLGMRPFSFLFGGMLGFYDGFFGPGTGSFWAMAFVLFCGFDLRRATAHTKAMNLASNLGSLGLFLAVGKVHFAIGAAMIGGQLIGGWLGSHLAITRGNRFIRVLFLAIVFAITLKLLWTP